MYDNVCSDVYLCMVRVEPRALHGLLRHALERGGAGGRGARRRAADAAADIYTVGLILTSLLSLIL